MKEWKSEETPHFFHLSALDSGQQMVKTGIKMQKKEEKFGIVIW